MREMKDSGVEWIGEIPKDWKLERLQWHLDEIVEKNDPIVTTQVLSLTNKKGVIPYEEKGAQGNVAKESYDGYKIAYPNTIVANSMNILIGSVGYSNYYGCVSPVYYVFKEKDNNDLRFINYIMQTSQFQKELRRYANGILEIRLRVSSGNILKRFCAFPDYQEQSRIADYLDSKCSQIDDIIEKQQTIIEKLKEYKLSVITDAITKGLKSNTKMKDSGYAYIGEIPFHWHTIKIKSIIHCLPGYAFSSDDFSANKGIPLLRGINVTPDGLRWEDTVYWDKDIPAKIKPFLLKERDVVVGLDRPWIANGMRVAVMEKEDLPCLLLQRVCRIRPVNHHDYRIVYHWINSHAFESALKIETTGVSVPHISTKQIENFTIALPPYDEEKEICDFLDDKCKSIDKTMKERCFLIEKLQEYKKSLIYEVVTGKKEV